jgi:hypothetical protein
MLANGELFCQIIRVAGAEAAFEHWRTARPTRKSMTFINVSIGAAIIVAAGASIERGDERDSKDRRSGAQSGIHFAKGQASRRRLLGIR